MGGVPPAAKHRENQKYLEWRLPKQRHTAGNIEITCVKSNNTWIPKNGKKILIKLQPATCDLGGGHNASITCSLRQGVVVNERCSYDKEVGVKKATIS